MYIFSESENNHWNGYILKSLEEGDYDLEFRGTLRSANGIIALDHVTVFDKRCSRIEVDKTYETYERSDETYERPDETYENTGETYERTRETYERTRETYERTDETYERTHETHEHTG